MRFQPATDLRAAHDRFCELAEKAGYDVVRVPPPLVIIDRQGTLSRSAPAGTIVNFFGSAPTTDLDGWMKVDLSKGAPPELGIGVIGFDLFYDQLAQDPADTSDASDVMRSISRGSVDLLVNGNTAGHCRGRDCLIGDVSSDISAGDTTSFVRSGLRADDSSPFMLPRPYLIGPNQRVDLRLTLDPTMFSSVAADPVVFGRLLCFVASKTSF